MGQILHSGGSQQHEKFRLRLSSLTFAWCRQAEHDILGDRILYMHQVLRRNGDVDTLKKFQTASDGYVLYEVSGCDPLVITLNTHAVIPDYDHRFTARPQNIIAILEHGGDILEEPLQ